MAWLRNVPGIRGIGIVAGLLSSLALIARIVSVVSSGGGGNIAVDTTGAGAHATRAPIAATPMRTAASAADGPVVVLNTRTVAQGSSISVYGRGFPSGATVDIYVKQSASENVNPVAVVEADNDGQFGGVDVTVPKSVSSRSVIIQAKDYLGRAKASATATVAEADLGIAPTPSASAAVAATSQATAQPTATSHARQQSTAQPTATQPTAQPTPQAQATHQPQRTAQPTPQPQPTQQPSRQPTQQAQPTSQPPTAQPTPQPQPARQPTQQTQPTPQPQPARQPTQQTQPTPQPKATSQPTPTQQPEAAHTSPTSYTIQPGDSLSAIAQRVYGNANDWKALYDANRGAIGDNPNLVHPGTKLDIPPKH